MKSTLTERVRYKETDKMGRVYHANYFVWFDMARTEYLRERGISYKYLEETGLFFVVAKTDCSFKAPLEFDDWIEIETSLIEIKKVSVVFEYKVYHKESRRLIAVASTTLAAVDTQGKMMPIPDEVVKKLEE